MFDPSENRPNPLIPMFIFFVTKRKSRNTQQSSLHPRNHPRKRATTLTATEHAAKRQPITIAVSFLPFSGISHLCVEKGHMNSNFPKFDRIFAFYKYFVVITVRKGIEKKQKKKRERKLVERNGGGGKQRGIKYSPFVSKFRGSSRLDFLGLLFLFEFCGRRIVVLSSSSSQNAAPKKVTSSLLLSHIGCFYTQ
uniref:Uncharacterized protein n=1 Tax=Solanum lycopersicum TaxID=4081 RepID=A0A3Q7EWL8_SOLLC